MSNARRAHGYHPLRVERIIQETADTRTFVLHPADDVADLFSYEPGQFCTFRVTVGDEELHRCYSMSSAPALDEPLAVTVKQVPGGRVSGWFHDRVAEGDVLDVAKPTGVFVLPESDRPIVAFAGGSGITPILSIVKTALATTDRSVRLLYANRDAGSVIFREVLDDLAAEHPDRFTVHHHLDSVGRYLTAEEVGTFHSGVDAEVFLCGPALFMDLVESTLLSRDVPAERIAIERFVEGDGEHGSPASEPASEPATAPAADADITEGVDADATDGDGTIVVTVILKGETTVIEHKDGDTVLATTRRGGLLAPFSCEAGNCATCMALCREGTATMRTNNALTPEEVAEGWVLTCQAIPDGPTLTVEYESY